MAKKFPASSSGGDPVGSYVEVTSNAPIGDKYLDATSTNIIAKADYPAWSDVSEVQNNKPTLTLADSEFEGHWSSHQDNTGYDYSEGKFFKVEIPFVTDANANDHCQLYESTDLVTWTARGVEISQNINDATRMTTTRTKAAWDGTSTYVVALDDGRVATSTDSGATWTAVDVSASNGAYCHGLWYMNGYFYYQRSSSTSMQYSSDGTTWANVNSLSVSNTSGYLVPITGGAFYAGSNGTYAYWTDPSLAVTSGTLATQASDHDVAYQYDIWSDGADDVIICATNANTGAHISRSADGGATWNAYTFDGSSRSTGGAFKIGSTYYFLTDNNQVSGSRTVFSTTDFVTFTEVTGTEDASNFTDTSIESTYVAYQRRGDLTRIFDIGGTIHFQTDALTITTTNMTSFTFSSIRQNNGGPSVVGTVSNNKIDGYYYYHWVDSFCIHLVKSRGVPSVHGGEYVASIERGVGFNSSTELRHSNGCWFLWDLSNSTPDEFLVSFDLVNWYSPAAFNYSSLSSGTQIRDVFYSKGWFWAITNTGTRSWRSDMFVDASNVASAGWDMVEENISLEGRRIWDVLGDGTGIVSLSYGATTNARWVVLDASTDALYTLGTTNTLNVCYSYADVGHPDYFYGLWDDSIIAISKSSYHPDNAVEDNTLAFPINAPSYRWMGYETVYIDGLDGKKYGFWPQMTSQSLNLVVAEYANTTSLEPKSPVAQDIKAAYTETAGLSTFYGFADSGGVSVDLEDPETCVFYNGSAWGFKSRDVIELKFFDYDPTTHVAVAPKDAPTPTTKYLVKVKE